MTHHMHVIQVLQRIFTTSLTRKILLFHPRDRIGRTASICKHTALMELTQIHQHNSLQKNHPHRQVPWFSFPQPLAHKTVVVWTLYSRTQAHTSSVQLLNPKKNVPFSKLAQNGYWAIFIQFHALSTHAHTTKPPLHSPLLSLPLL